MIEQRARLRLLAASVSIVAAVGASELMARRFVPTSDAVFESDPVVGIRHVPGGTGRWRSHGEFDTVITFNRQGFRDSDRPIIKPAGTERVVVLGDSMTEALQVDAPAAFVSILEKRLNAAGVRGEALNLGMSSIGTAQEYLILEHYGFQYSPDVVLLALFTGNDFRNNSQILERDPALSYPIVDAEGHLTRSAAGRPQFTKPPAPSRTRDFLRSHFHLYRMLRDSIVGQRWRRFVLRSPANPVLEQERQHGLYKKQWSAEWKAAVTTTLELLDALDAQVRRHHATLVVAILPAAWELSESWRQSVGIVGDSWDIDRPERVLLQFLADHHIVAIPLSARLGEAMAAGEDLFFKSDGHLNQSGHRIVGEVLATKLIDTQMVRVPLAAVAGQ